MVHDTHLMVTVTDASGAVSTAGVGVSGFPSKVSLRVEVADDHGGIIGVQHIEIPLRMVDAMGIPLETGLPAVKRSFLPPSEEEMLEAATKLGDLERRLEEDG